MNELIDAVKRGDIDRVARVLDADGNLVGQRDENGATALHYAALGGHRQIVKLLVERGADVNCADTEFGATPTGWAIEYLREIGGYLAFELDDFAYAIEQADAHWVVRILQRFPALRTAHHSSGKTFKQLAQASGQAEIVAFFEPGQ